MLRCAQNDTYEGLAMSFAKHAPLIARLGLVEKVCEVGRNLDKGACAVYVALMPQY